MQNDWKRDISHLVISPLFEQSFRLVSFHRFREAQNNPPEHLLSLELTSIRDRNILKQINTFLYPRSYYHDWTTKRHEFYFTFIFIWFFDYRSIVQLPYHAGFALLILKYSNPKLTYIIIAYNISRYVTFLLTTSYSTHTLQVLLLCVALKFGILSTALSNALCHCLERIWQWSQSSSKCRVRIKAFSRSARHLRLEFNNDIKPSWNSFQTTQSVRPLRCTTL